MKLITLNHLKTCIETEKNNTNNLVGELATTMSNALEEAHTEISKNCSVRTLWSGALISGGNISFSIPKDMFHNNETTITLVVESFMDHTLSGASGGTNPIMLTLSFGSSKDFGLDDGSYYPYYNADGKNFGYIFEKANTSYSTNKDIRLDVLIKKVVDTRYATCEVSCDELTTAGIVITSISAYVPNDLS